MSNSTSPIEHGYLVLADISGYTSFLSQTELDHAHEIITISKLEGDEVNIPTRQKPRGKTLIEPVESTYLIEEKSPVIKKRNSFVIGSGHQAIHAMVDRAKAVAKCRAEN